ncbi:hypothetical protein MASR1M12_19940 [Erysipelotrichia bacterium]
MRSDWKNGVVVAAIPDDYVSFFFGIACDHFIVDTRIDHGAHVDMGFVFFAFFDCAFVQIESL